MLIEMEDVNPTSNWTIEYGDGDGQQGLVNYCQRRSNTELMQVEKTVEAGTRPSVGPDM